MKKVLILMLTFLCATMFVVGCSGGDSISISLDKTTLQISQYDEEVLVGVDVNYIYE